MSDAVVDDVEGGNVMFMDKKNELVELQYPKPKDCIYIVPGRPLDEPLSSKLKMLKPSMTPPQFAWSSATSTTSSTSAAPSAAASKPQ
jgi:hypothetical protein